MEPVRKIKEHILISMAFNIISLLININKIYLLFKLNACNVESNYVHVLKES